jgi:hypothetical protein
MFCSEVHTMTRMSLGGGGTKTKLIRHTDHPTIADPSNELGETEYTRS